MSELKYPIELLVYPRESSGSGAYSLARTKNGNVRSVMWDYETQKWIKCNLSVGTIMASQMTLYEKDLRRLGLGYIIDDKIKFQDSGVDDEKDLIKNKSSLFSNFQIPIPRSIVMLWDKYPIFKALLFSAVCALIIWLAQPRS